MRRVLLLAVLMTLGGIVGLARAPELAAQGPTPRMGAIHLNTVAEWQSGARDGLLVSNNEDGELRLVERLMSLYRPDSQLCRLNGDRTLERPHPYLVEVLRMAEATSRQSAGAFDVTVLEAGGEFRPQTFNTEDLDIPTFLRNRK